MIIAVTTIFMAVTALAGCGQTNAQKQSASSTKTSSRQQSSSNHKQASKSSTSSKSSSASSQTATKAQTNTPWNASKDQKLKDFIKQWGPTMHQTYTEYDGHTPLKTSVGTTYPDALRQSQISGDAGTIGWSPKGDGNYDYNVVAIFNYNGTQPPLPNRITYVFAFHHGQPVALVDQSRDGGPSLSETQNTDVKAAFEKIAGNAAPSTTDTSDNTLDANTIGVLLKLKVGGGSLEYLAKSPYFGVYSYSDKYPYVADEGTAASQIPYRFTSTTVTYGLHDPNHTTSEGVFIDHTISVQSLADAYYHTPAQIAAVKQVVANLKH